MKRDKKARLVWRKGDIRIIKPHDRLAAELSREEAETEGGE